MRAQGEELVALVALVPQLVHLLIVEVLERPVGGLILAKVAAVARNESDAIKSEKGNVRIMSMKEGTIDCLSVKFHYFPKLPYDNGSPKADEVVLIF